MNSKIKREILYIVISIIVIASIAIFVVISGNNKYVDLEKSMLLATNNYIKTGKIDFQDQYYFTISNMGIKDIYDCNKDSGVLAKKENNTTTYQVYLICDSYKSEAMKLATSKYIELIGANPLIVENNTAFSDPGYNSNGYRVEKTSNFKNSPGLYIVTYKVFEGESLKETVNRYVIVSNTYSIDAPVINLNGDENIIIKVGGTYVEPGYYAIDPIDGNITSKVLKKATVNTDEIGDYEVTYEVTNSKGLTTVKKRIVSVVDKNLNVYAQSTISPDVPTKDKVIINLKILGGSYSHMVLPDESEIKETSVDYPVSENGLYVFKIYDTSGNEVEKKVTIDNIDKVPPTGSCIATSEGGVLTYTVQGEDVSEIKGYSYFTDNGYTEFKSENTFKVESMYDGASVIIEDAALNTTKVSCEVSLVSTIKSATIPESSTIYVGDSYMIPVTIIPTSGDRKEIKFDIISGADYITLENGTIKGISEGTSIIRMRILNSDIEKQMTITVLKKA